MARIYINVEGDNFLAKGGKTYPMLYTIERKVTGNMQLSGAVINGKQTYVDGTVPTLVDKLPKGAKRVPLLKAIELYNKDSHYFGE